MKKSIFFTIPFILTQAFFIQPLSAQAKAGASLNFSSGYVHTANEYDLAGTKINFPLEKDNWITSSDLHLKVDTQAKSIVKAYFDASLALSTIPESDITKAGVLATLTLNKAYLKARLPWFCDQEAKLTVGKMPLSWGFGLYYNAGDLIFGADPNNPPDRKDTSLSFTSVEAKSGTPYEAFLTKDRILELLTGSGDSSATSTSFSSSSLSDFRTSTDWMASFYMPLGNHLALESIAIFPFDTALNTRYGRAGARVQIFTNFTPIQQIQAGYLSPTDFSTQKAFLAFDGTLYLDYNLCSSITFDKNDGFSKDDFNISFSLTKIFGIQTDTSNHSLQIKAESLWNPFADRLQLFAFASYDITDALSLSATYLFYGPSQSKISDNSQTAALALTYQPTTHLEFSLQAALDCKNPDKLAAILAGVTYRY